MTEIKITEEKDNALFKRKEIKAIVHSDKSPSREEISKLLADKFSTKNANVKIKRITGNFGSKTFSVEANVYSSIDIKELIETKKKKDSKAQENKPVEAVQSP